MMAINNSLRRGSWPVKAIVRFHASRAAGWRRYHGIVLRASIFILCFSALASAEIRPLTLKQAVEAAIRQNPELVLARLDEQRARAGIRVAKDPFSPKLYAGSGLAYTLGYPTSIDGSAPSVFQAKTEMSIFNRPKTFELAAARENARGSGLDTANKTDDIAYRVASLFLDAQQFGRGAQSLRQEVQALQQVAEAIRLRVAEGRDLPIAAKRSELNIARARQRQEAGASDLDYAEEFLAVILGFPAGDRIQPQEEQSPLTGAPETEQACIDDALKNNKDIRRIESQMQAKGLELRAQKSQRYPQVDLVAQYALFAQYNYSDFFRRFSRNNAQLGVSIRLPILIGSGPAGLQAQAEVDIVKLRTRMNDTRNQLRLETRRSFHDVKRAESGQEVAKLDLEVAREQLKLLLDQLEEGRTTRQAVEEARMAEQEKWLSFYDSQHLAEKARLMLLKQTGNLQAALR